MAKKAQIITRPILVAVSAFMIGLLMFAGIRTVVKFNERQNQMAYDNFVTSLSTALNNQRLQGVGSLRDLTFSVPGGIELVCFFDDNKEIRAYRNNEVVEYKNNYPEYNVFFSPSKFDPEQVDYVSLRNDENPLCIEPVKGKIRLGLQSEGRATQVTSLVPEAIAEDCISVLYQGDPEEKIDVVFLGYKYKTSADFEKDVNDRINNIMFKIYPFGDHKSKFNIYRVDKFDLGCEVGGFIKCDSFEIQKLASKCPNDYVFVLVDRSVVVDALNPVRSSAIGNLAKVNTADDKFVLMHEFGHTFPLTPLADEYVDVWYESQGFDPSNFPNCDTIPCSKWSDITDNCIQG
ncbi:MAG: hypothetical protein KJ922_02910, partial [Nanoarchaeota archaeon]|nr:hypothetical protein [Nanoarchaeota archaeon]